MKLVRLAFDPGTGWSAALDPSLDGERTLALVFGAPELDVAPALAELRARLPRAALVGCSTAGEIHHTSIRDASISAVVVAFDHTPVRVATHALDATRDSRAAGAALGRTLADPALRAVFVLADGLAVNGSALAQGLADVLDPRVVVTGGLAGDGERFCATWVVVDDLPRRDVVTAVGLYGDHVRVGHGSRGGWDVFGPERRVTRADDNVLFELDGKPALALYKQYLGERAAELPAAALRFPLAVSPPDAPDRRVVRTILSIDDTADAMRLAGDIPVGSNAQLMMANLERLITGAADAAASARLDGDGPTLALAVSCIGRRLVLGGRTEEELEAVLEMLPPDTTQLGFYSYGELSPGETGACDLHNQTMTLTTIREASAP